MLLFRRLYTEPIRHLMMSNHLFGDLHLPLLARAFLKRISFSRFPTSLLVICFPITLECGSHRTCSLIGSCFLLMIKLLFFTHFQVSSASFVRSATSFFIICHQHRMFTQHIGKWRKQVIVQVHIFLLSLDILLLYVILCNLIIADLARAIWCHISANDPPPCLLFFMH